MSQSTKLTDPNLIMLARVTAVEQALMAVISVLPTLGTTTTEQIQERADALREMRDTMMTHAGDHLDGKTVNPAIAAAMTEEIRQHLARLFDGLSRSDVVAAVIDKYTGPAKQEH